MNRPPEADLLGSLPSPERAGTAEELKGCCAAAYEHPAVRWLLGGELHPGGERTTLRALELARVQPGMRLLDVASGDGRSALLAARELGCEAVGLDYGAAAVQGASDAAREAGLADRVRFVRGDAESLPFDDGAFDAVLCECSLCTFPDKAAAAAEIARVLRPGGALALCDVVVSEGSLPDELAGPLATIACVGEAMSEGGYRELLNGAGLRVVATESRRSDAAALARRVHDRLRGARLLLGADRLEASPLDTAGAIRLAGLAVEAIERGALGYSILAATR